MTHHYGGRLQIFSAIVLTRSDTEFARIQRFITGSAPFLYLGQPMHRSESSSFRPFPAFIRQDWWKGKYGVVHLRFVGILYVFLALTVNLQAQNRYFIVNSDVTFVSEAALERIEAKSSEMKGVIDTDTRSFAFSVSNESFDGFNSVLQKDHFNENYIESDKNPSCLFSGKIIDEINFLKDGTYLVRVKGILNIKGIPQERIIKSTIWVKGNDIFIECDFGVLLADHEIRIPRIVQQKIAPEIKISVKAKLKKEVKK